MTSPEFKPWWERTNEYLKFEERENFLRGVGGYRPNQKMEALMGLLSAGYVNNKFEKPQSYTGKKQ